MLRKYISLVVLGSGLLFSSCQKEEIPTYTDAERINFDLREMDLNKDSIEVALGFFQGDVKELPLKLYVMGYPKDYAREVIFKVISTDGAVAGKTYELPANVEIAKDEITCSVILSLLRDPDLQTAAKSFMIELVNSNELAVGIYSKLYVKVTDGIPTTWIGDEDWFYGKKIVDYFGECSRKKYEFVYAKLGIYDFSVWVKGGYMMDASKMEPAKRYLKKELAAYEAANGPLVDEEKGPVTFPE